MIELAIIAAVAKDGYIGLTKDGKVGFPWPRLEGDLPRFKAITTGHPIIMGRKTYESFPVRPLPDRLNVILSNTAEYSDPGVIVVKSLDAAIEILEHGSFKGVDASKAVIIGGYQPFNEALVSNRLQRIYLTEVHGCYGGDTFFPYFDRSQWQEVKREKHPRGTHSYVDLIKK
ncbi:dihydrofolate reductase [Candidatus Woesearchaeota archaeon]|nr:dihydrofolate reductase [Candidatus Woesearchaeota archaeon]